MVKILTFFKNSSFTCVDRCHPNYRPSSYNSSFSQLVPALVFISFKKGFDKDISPATISSWIKQTVILCYELSDHQAHTLHQVKAHDVRAFAASKAFQSGVSLDQILSACHWKSHNTFTQFYLKDVAWADSELYHLGPVVAAQQIHK